MFLFLPIVLAGYYLFPSRFGLRNYWLLIASLFFYAWGEPAFVVVMATSVLFNYVFGLLANRLRGRRGARLVLWTAVAGNLAVIGLWKYANFVTATIRNWIPLAQGVVPQTSFVLPLGISFFTFQAMSYVIDVARGNVKVQKNPFLLALYIALFPQLIAGPIVRYSTVCEQIQSRKTTLGDLAEGIMRFLYGFNKKVLFANSFAVVADRAFTAAAPGCAMAWLGAVSYTLQIFFDFSGYSDMAIGLGRMFGFHFQENFDYPYVAKSVTEFWRRWHISLGSWFRDYVYFPLGGSRVDSKFRLVFNLFVVWLLTGIWHGANWTFILWGVLYGVFITVEKLLSIPKKIESRPWLRGCWQPFTMFLVVLGWVLFRSENLSSARRFIAAMFSPSAGPVSDLAAWNFSGVAVLLVLGALCSTPLFRMLRERMAGHWSAVALCRGVQFLLFAFSLSHLVMEAHNPFIYFNF